jgi:N-acetylmuramoyl-L-alanine amidase
MNTVLRIFLFGLVLISGGQFCAAASEGSIDRIEVSSNAVSVKLMFDFPRSVMVRPAYNEDNQTLDLFFPNIQERTLKANSNWSQIEALSSMGIAVSLKSNQGAQGSILSLCFAGASDSNGRDKNDDQENQPAQFLVEYSNVDGAHWGNADRAGNRFVVDIFSAQALRQLNKTTTVLCATNDVLQNDFMPIAGLKKKPSSRRIMVDAGHGGNDFGARGCGNIHEKEIALQVSRRLVKKLRAAGHQAYLTRDDDRNVPLVKRCSLAGQLKADVLISVHLNSSGKIGSRPSGVETYYLSKAGLVAPSHVGGYFFVNGEKDTALINAAHAYAKNKTEGSKLLAQNVHSQLLGTLRRSQHDPIDRGVKADHMRLLMHSSVPTTLVEIGFITNPQEAEKLKSAPYQELVAAGIAGGVLKYFDQL